MVAGKYDRGVAWPWIVLLVAAVALVAAAESARLGGVRERRTRARRRGRSSLRVVADQDEEFVRSVQDTLDALPTFEGPRSRKTL